MKRISLIILIAIMIAVLAFPFCFIKNAYALDTPEEWEYLDTGGDADSTGIYGINWCAMQFTSGSEAHTVTSIKLELQRVGNPGTVYCVLRLADSVTHLPTGEDLTYGTYNGDIFDVTYAWFTFTMITEYSLEANTEYAIVVYAPTGGAADYVEWHLDSGGGLATSEASHSTNNGESWTTDSPADALFQIWGNSVLEIIDIAVFEDYLEDGDLLICTAINVNYPPYSATGIAQDYFQLQLLSVGGASVLGATPIVNWGYQPQALILSSTSAASISWGDAYQIRIIGTYASPPSVTQTLVSANWYGADMVKLDNWIRNTAYRIQTYYGYSGTNVLLTNVSGIGEVLTDIGGAYFTQSIPGIAQERPNIFAIAKSKPLFSSTTPNNVYDQRDYRTMVGTPIADDLDVFGDLFSITGKNFAGILILFAIGVVILAGVILGGGAAAIPIFVVSGLPLLFIGNHLGLIGIQWTLVLAIIMCVLFIRQFWWKAT